MSLTRSLLLFVLAAVGCAADAPGRSRASLDERVALESTVQEEAPQGGDGPTTHRLVLVRHGERVEVAADAIAWVPGTRHVIVLTRDGTLTLVGHDRERHELDTNVATPPVRSPDGERVAWARHSGELKVWDGVRTTTVAQGLLSAGALRFAPDGVSVLFVNARNGGVAGVWVASGDGHARCLTNCSLRVGQPFDGYVPPPLTAEALTFSGNEVRWPSGDGGEKRVRWRE